MKLNVVNPIASSLDEAIGIPEERSDELSNLLDVITKEYEAIGKPVAATEVYGKIVGFYNNLEEVIYCILNHANFMAIKYGIVVSPFKDKNNVTDKQNRKMP